ncbi:MAG: hypothetical protein PWP07_542 [Epulopiscium sp.]|jgi:uncharacterized membrane-anchored protein YhcB (DUF1043 family)|uniref:Uncharacterized protein n=1 Tax=Defluviitalea raffinosedens TaxID=1450156 RepID=A0A7C8HHJ2_9FIRM|nr:hypothetical protein [Defluviitalea raffinosedens]MBZ4668599.1 hypothetical protein [Defluviitaleaceae bacterium]MDK2787317.1 hypothetical protein [Candidatus Epulonipiscium sp.]KAE9633212.1 hypothetical protein GND95_10100 [Defluviitalea raffinosedens]MBM7686970.1 uncharacterized membrane-anchored protein YhcB (DUF1043 family) [Defluviitalea raffinosedens]HHW68094.1 hypothetical protein [Candidatus Epulonipiscium sp.]
MFWTGIIIGIFIGATLGILVMSMAISAARNSSEEHRRSIYGMETSEELAPNVHYKKDKKEEKDKKS